MSADISNFVATKRDMIERLVVIDSVDPVIFYGVNNSNMQLIRSLFPKLRVAARGRKRRSLRKKSKNLKTIARNIISLERR